MSLVLVRVDSRLVHGQVVEGWVPHVHANCLLVVNDDLEPTVTRLREIIEAERSRTHRMTPVAEKIIRTFQLTTRIDD